MGSKWPWRMNRIEKFKRPLQYMDCTKRWAIAACSTRASRRNALQPTYRTARFGLIEEPIYRQRVDIPFVSENVNAIQVDKTLFGDIYQKLSRVASLAGLKFSVLI